MDRPISPEPADWQASRTARKIYREEFLDLLNAALTQGEVRFARQVALAWLAAFPGDIPIRLKYAQALYADGQLQQAQAMHQQICFTDPEYLEAVQSGAQANAAVFQREQTQTRHKSTAPGGAPLGLKDWSNWVEALSGDSSLKSLPGTAGARNAGRTQVQAEPWAGQLFQARLALQKSDFNAAAERLNAALAQEPAIPLAAATHLQYLRAQAQNEAAPRPLNAGLQRLVEYYHQRWPDCVQITLIMAETWMELGQQERAVSLLHEAVVKDLTGQAAARLWGAQHPYRSLWPEGMNIELDQPIPAAVSARLGLNQLMQGLPQPTGAGSFGSNGSGGFGANGNGRPQPAPTQARPAGKASAASRRRAPRYPHLPESLRSVQAELEKIAARLKRPNTVRSDRRFPVYVFFTCKSSLERQYGAAAAQIGGAMQSAAAALRAGNTWGALVFYADTGLSLPGNAAQLPIGPARSDDPWELKLALADLDVSLSKNGQMIGAVLIVGGPQIVPFHRLPNPVDDSDNEVLSDNPYGTRDENYFIPEWPVGRLPGDSTSSPELLLKELAAIRQRHAPAKRGPGKSLGLAGLWRQLLAWLGAAPAQGVRPLIPQNQSSLGLTAAIWKQASLSVFEPIGEARHLLVSPPVQAPSLNGTQPASEPILLGGPAPIPVVDETVEGELEAELVLEAPSAARAGRKPAPAQPPAAPRRAANHKNGNKPASALPRNAWLQPKLAWLRLPFHGKNGRKAPQDVVRLPVSRFGYFNLHGIQDGAEWFGQRDPGEMPAQATAGLPAEGDFPVALRPKDIRALARPPEAVFSEACYGANIIEKTVEQAMSLQLLDCGSQLVVASTCTSYGSIAPPLSAADYLGHAFWRGLADGLPGGEALRRAKIALAREMNDRQGYLDGEDQKTLIQFVLYGDPLACPMPSPRQAKNVVRPLRPPAAVKMACDRASDQDSNRPVPVEVLLSVKSVVEQYLPGMKDARILISRTRPVCQADDHACPTQQLGGSRGAKTDARPIPNSAAPGADPSAAERQVVTLSKLVPGGAHVHPLFARLTLDEKGLLVKLVVSR